MSSMLNTIIHKQPDRQVTFIHAAINRNTHAMHEDVKQITSNHAQVNYYVCYGQPTDADRTEQRYDKEGFEVDSLSL